LLHCGEINTVYCKKHRNLINIFCEHVARELQAVMTCDILLCYAVTQYTNLI